MNKSSEKALMYSIGCGDVRAMKHLVDKYLDLVSRTSFRILCDRKDSDAVTCEVFEHAWDYSETFDAENTLDNWILHQTCRRARQRILRRRIMYIFGQRPDIYVTTAPKADDCDDYLTKQAWELYCRISVSFSITQRVVFSLCELEELPHDDVAVITGLSVKQIGFLLDNARTRLRKELRRYGKEDEYFSYVGFLRRVKDGLADHDRLKKEIMASVR
jgi:DNA-directed RNA polymerase specialized sigma24 family protein